MELWPDGTALQPFGTALVLTPTIVRDTGKAGLGAGPYAVKITGAGAANEGISYTLSTLEASTTYAVSGWAKATAGDTASITTTGGSTNISTTVTATSWTLFTGTFTTDATPTNIVLNLLAAADTDIVWFDGILVVKGPIPMAFAEGLMDGARRLGFRVYANAAQSLTANTWTKITLDTETFDNNDKFDSTTNYRYTPGEDGYYLITGSLKIDTANDGQRINADIYKNGAAVADMEITAGAAAHTGITISDVVWLDENDYVELYGLSGATKNTVAGTATVYFAGFKIN